MFLLVQTNGSRLWRLSYRYAGKQKTMALGTYPDVSLADARKKRTAAREVLKSGRDPSKVKQGLPSRPRERTFESIAKEWLGLQTTWSEGHASRIIARMEADVYPTVVHDEEERDLGPFGQRVAADIEAIEVLEVVRAVERRGAIDTAKRVRQTIGQIFRYGIAISACQRDPSADIRDALQPSPPVVHYAKLKANELPEFFNKLEAYDGERQTALALELVTHTFVRTKVMRFAEKREFEDLDGPMPLWRVPAERMKVRREHLVPLSPRAVTLVKDLMALSGDSPLLAPGKKGLPLSGNTMIFALYRMGYHSRVTVHGLRGTASTILNEQGFDRDWIELQLAHDEDDASRAAYNSAQWLAGRRGMMNWYSTYLEQQRDIAGLLG